uniref:S-acyltransferase n=1 Tax=Fagus sylvatica TaxID=28930 RepID=A0A2N9I7I4_FAGSY
MNSMEGMEKDLEVMEPVALSDPPEQSFEVEKEVSGKGGNILVTMWEKLFAFKRVVEDQLVLVNLIMVSAIDPGIIPRNDQLSTEDVGTSDGTRRRKIIVNGVELRLKYCRICKIYRPPRSCHCAICDNCVDKFDHHCPWIGQCIALRNYRFYLTFVVSALVFFVYLSAFSCWKIHQRILRSGTGLMGLLRNCPETLALVLFGVAAIGFLGGLALFHVYLTAKNQTAYENFRQRYVGSKNPFDKGILNNIMEVLLLSLPPSRVDFRAEVTPRWSSTAARVV